MKLRERIEQRGFAGLEGPVLDVVEAAEELVAHCYSCDGTGKAFTMEDETAFGMTPGSSEIKCPECCRARDALLALKKAVGER